jgi:hypothetical protein
MKILEATVLFLKSVKGEAIVVNNFFLLHLLGGTLMPSRSS